MCSGCTVDVPPWCMRRIINSLESGSIIAQHRPCVDGEQLEGSRRREGRGNDQDRSIASSAGSPTSSSGRRPGAVPVRRGCRRPDTGLGPDSCHRSWSTFRRRNGVRQCDPTVAIGLQPAHRGPGEGKRRPRCLRGRCQPVRQGSGYQLAHHLEPVSLTRWLSSTSGFTFGVQLGGEDSNPQWQGQNLLCCRLHHPRRAPTSLACRGSSLDPLADPHQPPEADDSPYGYLAGLLDEVGHRGAALDGRRPRR